MSISVNLFLLVLLFLQTINKGSAEKLLDVIDELNTRLEVSTNIIYNPELEDLHFLRHAKPTSQLIFNSTDNSTFNATQMFEKFGDNIIFVLFVSSPPNELLKKLCFLFQKSDFLLVIEEYNMPQIWLDFVHLAWQLGYMKLLFYIQNESLYTKHLFPELKLQISNVENYVAIRNYAINLHGFEIRVAAYSNAPRCLVYDGENGNKIYGGYYMRFIQHFLAIHNAKFVPVITPNDSPGHCIRALLSRRVDLCADALATGSDKSFEVTNPIRLAYANIMVQNAKLLSSYRYLVAPFHSSVWICLLVYIAFMVLFMSYIHWQQKHRWIFSTFLLETISSLLFSGFFLKDLHGRERYIIFVVLFIAGFIYSTFYVGYLKSILTTEMFGDQINSFEQLLQANISIIIDEYDRNLSRKYALPDMLWPIMKVVPDETLWYHRSRLDQQYAYILFSDRMDLYDYSQKYLKNPRMRRIPINIFFLYAGFPMRESWFLKQYLSQAWANAFESGLLQKLELDADHETMSPRVGLLKYHVTEYYEAKPLDLDYFVMPAMSLAFGFGLAFLTFLIELMAWRMQKKP